MEVNRDRSSSNDLSSAPSSDAETPFDSRPDPTHPSNSTARQSTTSSTIVTNNKNGAQASATNADKPKIRRPRKPKEIDPNAPPKEKRPRKPRVSAGTTTASRKKIKVEDSTHNTPTLQQQSIISSLGSSTLVQPTSFANAEVKAHPLHEAAKISQNGFSNPSSAMSAPPHSPQLYQRYEPPLPPPPQQRSRAIFDPVRGIERAAAEPTPSAYTPQQNATPPRAPMQRSSASPAIASLINHEPDGTSLTFHSRPSTAQYPSYSNSKDTPEVDSTVRATETPVAPAVSDSTSTKKIVDLTATASENESKPKRAKEKPPPVPIGSGLLNSTFFGGEGTTEKPELGKGVSVVLEIPLKRGENKIFNFAKLAEEKYGFAAVYPRQAAQKKRLAEVAAAGAALERSASGSKRGETSNAESADEDISEDLDRDSDNDGDVNMTGLNGGTVDNSGTDAPTKKKRKLKDDQYELDDGFVDDSEMVWESQAVVSRDGFFVYMGSLVPEVDKNTTEKNETISRRGRGRGRGGGVGSRGGRGAASAAQANGESTGRGSATTRGTGISRKPRVTKAERAQRDKEKADREAAGASLSTMIPSAVPA